MSDYDPLAKLDELRRIPHTWIQLICNSRTQAGDLAWSLSCKYGVEQPRNVQYVAVDLAAVVRLLELHFEANGVVTPPKRKIKLKRSTQ